MNEYKKAETESIFGKCDILVTYLSTILRATQGEVEYHQRSSNFQTDI